MSYSGVLGYGNNTDTVLIFVPFPFLCKNTNYTIEVTSIYVDGSGTISTSAVSVETKAKNGVSMSIALPGTSYKDIKMFSDLILNITFA